MSKQKLMVNQAVAAMANQDNNEMDGFLDMQTPAGDRRPTWNMKPSIEEGKNELTYHSYGDENELSINPVVKK